MVGRLVQYQEVGLGNERIGKRHSLTLTATELPHRLREVYDFKPGQDLLGLHYLLIIALMVEAGIQHGVIGIKDRFLLQIPRAYSIALDNSSFILALSASKD